MRKVDPKSVVDDFRRQVSASLLDWQVIDAALLASGVAIRRKAATDAFLQLAVTWESFLSDWWIAAINRDATTFVATRETRLRSHAEENMHLTASDLSATLITRNHLDLESVRRLVDPAGANIVFRDLRQLKKAARTDLAPLFRTKVMRVTAANWQVADVTRVIRNALAHQSTRSVAEVNDRLKNTRTKAVFRWTGDRKLSMAGLRRYIRTPDQSPRLAEFHAELSALARALRT